MKPILFVTLALVLNCGYVHAESNGSTLESKVMSLGSIEIAIPDGWQYETATQPNKQVVTQIFHPDKDGVLQIGSGCNNVGLFGPDGPEESPELRRAPPGGRMHSPAPNFGTRERMMNRSIESFPRAIEATLAMPDSLEKSRRLNVIYRMWARQSPEQAYQSVNNVELPDVFPLSGMQSMIITSWIKLDPDAAMQAALQTNDTGIIEHSFQDYAYQDGESAMRLARQLNLEDQVWSGIYGNVASRDVQLAVESVQALGNEGKKFLDSIMPAYAHDDVKAAIAWIVRHYPSEAQHFDALTSHLLVVDRDGAGQFLKTIEDRTTRKKLQKSLERAIKISKGIRP